MFLTPAVERLIDLALEEDLGRSDVTTTAIVTDRSARAEAIIAAREPLVVAGTDVARRVFDRVAGERVWVSSLDDGTEVAAGTEVARVCGPATALLAAERTALNFLQRLSGVATTTRRYVAAAGGAAVRIADTRKTTPGFRALEKAAVLAAGGANHRFDLGSGVLIKDNHVVVAGGVAEAVRRVRGRVPHGLKIEVEVDTLAQLEEALDAATDVVLLDNFTLADVEQAVRRVRERAPGTIVEVSGGVTLARIPELVRAGVDVISVGALTHSARAVDLGLDFLSARPHP